MLPRLSISSTGTSSALALDYLSGDFDPVPGQDPREIRPGLVKAVDHGFVAVLKHDHLGREAHHLVEEHLLVVRAGFDQEEVDLGVFLPAQP